MRKQIYVALLMFFMVFMGVIPAQASNIEVTCNGSIVTFPDQAPFINDNRTMVPVRAPMEAMGADVDWNPAKQQATITKGDKTAVFTIGSKQYAVNGKVMQMDTIPVIKNGRTCFPIRYVAEAIGLYVGWDSDTQRVTIATEKTPDVISVPEATPAQTAMTELTPEAKARLMAYPYPAGVEIWNGMIKCKEECIAAGFSETYAQEKLQSYLNQKALINPNQHFFFDSDLCYDCSGLYNRRVRGVLQTENSNNTITEQDVEYGFNYGAVAVPHGQTPQPAHLLEGYNFVELSSPIKL